MTTPLRVAGFVVAGFADGVLALGTSPFAGADAVDAAELGAVGVSAVVAGVVCWT